MNAFVEDAVWESLWAPYDEETYSDVLDAIPPGSTILDIGAGDLRLALRLAARANRVYAIEIQQSLTADVSVPDNVCVLTGDARTLPFPQGIDVAVLLMRHCTHFALYREKLMAAGCRLLITNARWGMGVECIDLMQPADDYHALEYGWYACQCGATGFKSGPPEQLTAAAAETIVDVNQCPECNTLWLE